MSKRYNNPKPFGIMEAKKQFTKDLYEDVDFIEYKKRSHDYGSIIVSRNYYVIEGFGPSCQTLISRFFKSIKQNKNVFAF